MPDDIPDHSTGGNVVFQRFCQDFSILVRTVFAPEPVLEDFETRNSRFSPTAPPVRPEIGPRTRDCENNAFDKTNSDRRQTTPPPAAPPTRVWIHRGLAKW